MSDIDERLKRLLDGDVDPEEIARDSTLASIAERVYGLSIEPITPSRDLEMPEISTVSGGSNESRADLMIEVTESALPTSMELPKGLELPPLPTKLKKGMSKIRMLGLAGVVFSIINLFGVLAMMFGGICDDATNCPSDGHTKLNWLEMYRIDSSFAWSEPFPKMGIPDYAAMAGSLLLVILGRRR